MGRDMKTSESGLEFIKEHEGCVLRAYPDPGTGGEPFTIGVGHTGGVSPGDVITEEEALELLREDVEEAESAVNRLVSIDLTQNEFDALVSFVFNVGAGNFEKSTLRKMLNDGNREGAEQQFQRWNKAAGRVLPGLVKRRHAESSLFAGEYGSVA